VVNSNPLIIFLGNFRGSAGACKLLVRCAGL